MCWRELDLLFSFPLNVLTILDHLDNVLQHLILFKLMLCQFMSALNFQFLTIKLISVKIIQKFSPLKTCWTCLS